MYIIIDGVLIYGVRRFHSLWCQTRVQILNRIKDKNMKEENVKFPWLYLLIMSSVTFMGILS
jgi:hypothetical protein